MNKKDYAYLAVFLLISLAAGAIGSLFTVPAIPEWYAGLEKPPFTPPNWIFGPVWTALYLAMGAALFLVWKPKVTDSKAAAYAWFGLQLILNTLWSAAFFGQRSPLLGIIVIVPLLAAVLATVAAFRRHSLPAAALLIPYAAWTSFAAALNFSILMLN